MKKKKFYIIVAILFGCLCLLGCDTPSNDNLNDSNPKYKYTFEQYDDLTKFYSQNQEKLTKNYLSISKEFSEKMMTGINSGFSAYFYYNLENENYKDTYFSLHCMIYDESLGASESDGYGAVPVTFVFEFKFFEFEEELENLTYKFEDYKSDELMFNHKIKIYNSDKLVVEAYCYEELELSNQQIEEYLKINLSLLGE